MKIVQVGDVAGVAGMLPIESVRLPFHQAGAFSRFKLLGAPARMAEAAHVARAVRRLRPDVVHVHWAPNGIVGPLTGRPWVLHLHGDDARGWRRWAYWPLRRLAKAALASTPDLPGEYVPNPVPVRERGEDRYGVAIASRPHRVKGTDIAEQAVAPDWRAPLPREEFLRRLAQTRVVIGQLVIGALGLVELEAMSFGRPVVCYVRSDLYSSPPPVVNARTVDDVRKHVRRLLADPDEATRIGDAGQEWVRRHHNPAKVRAQLLSIYDSVR